MRVRLDGWACSSRRRDQSPGITQAVAIAFAQGWRRPLLAWLGVQAKRPDAATAKLRRASGGGSSYSASSL